MKVPAVRWLAVALLALAAAALVAARMQGLAHTALAPAGAAALAGYLGRRRWSDAVALALSVIAADAVELDFAAYVMMACSLPLFALTLRPPSVRERTVAARAHPVDADGEWLGRLALPDLGMR